MDDGKVLGAAHEERFSRIKHDNGFPFGAIDYLLKEFEINDPNELDVVVYYENPWIKLSRIQNSYINQEKNDSSGFSAVVSRWLCEGRLNYPKLISNFLKIDPGKIKFVDHHLAHAAAAFFSSPFDEALIITLDGVGEFETSTISHGNKKTISKISSVNFPNSLGLFYSGFTSFLGFEVNEGEYKVMGLSAYGKPIYYQELKDTIEIKKDGSYRLEQNLFDFENFEDLFTKKLLNWLGTPRDKKIKFGHFDENENLILSDADKHYANIASSIQKFTEESILEIVRKASSISDTKNICISGGVGLNSLANGRIVREIGCPLFVYPAAGDAGSAIGACMAYLQEVNLMKKDQAEMNCYLGKENKRNDIEKALLEEGLEFKFFENENELITIVAKKLSENKVIGWMQGKAEWGPRALGNRSILATPLGKNIKRIVNEKIKFREAYRPFAPAVTIENYREFFDIPERKDDVGIPELYMLSICQVKDKWKEYLPAITHTDGSARVQLVRKTMNPKFHKLLSVFGRNTGFPIILNTSFNLNGEPIVNDANDAIHTFNYSDLDYLVLGNFLVEK